MRHETQKGKGCNGENVRRNRQVVTQKNLSETRTADPSVTWRAGAGNAAGQYKTESRLDASRAYVHTCETVHV